MLVKCLIILQYFDHNFWTLFPRSFLKYRCLILNDGSWNAVSFNGWSVAENGMSGVERSKNVAPFISISNRWIKVETPKGKMLIFDLKETVDNFTNL